jgi:hypothetical protein
MLVVFSKLKSYVRCEVAILCRKNVETVVYVGEDLRELEDLSKGFGDNTEVWLRTSHG